MSKKTTKLIVGSGNDYVIQVKGNQPKLLERIKQIEQQEEPLDIHESLDKSRGRKVRRHTEVYENIGGFDIGWINLNRIIKVTRSGTRSGKSFDEIHYYISSKKNSKASYFAKGIRSHWGIENKLHWVKDKVMIEDDGGIKSSSIVANLSLMRSVVISLFRINKFASITFAIEQFNNRIAESLALMNNTHICELEN